ncbi:hypothetical protein GJ496_006748 [Pomphorhynchus laevis]|nr:hypothetical protein GJ496_006748 [Pomphorhynchus laevis]
MSNDKSNQQWTVGAVFYHLTSEKLQATNNPLDKGKYLFCATFITIDRIVPLRTRCVSPVERDISLTCVKIPKTALASEMYCSVPT